MWHALSEASISKLAGLVVFVPQQHFLEQDFEALGLDDAIPIKVRRDSNDEQKVVRPAMRMMILMSTTAFKRLTASCYVTRPTFLTRRIIETAKARVGSLSKPQTWRLRQGLRCHKEIRDSRALLF